MVLGKVTRLGARFASLEILVVGDVVCRESFGGQIRREDVRATEKDKVLIPDSFRVGDIVRGEFDYFIGGGFGEYDFNRHSHAERVQQSV